MVTCAQCNGSSKVMDSRYHVINEKETKIRVRQCKKCRWRWKTIEIEYKETANASV